MDVEELEWVQRALINYERDRCVAKFCSVEGEDAVAKGNNFSSDIMRIKMKAVLNSGEVQERSVIFKMMPKTEHRRKALMSYGATVMEARMLTEVLPKMEQYMLSKDKSSEPLVPTLYGIRNGNEDFLLEDLQASGFVLANRREGIDFDHLVLAARVLAKYHALGAALIERGEILARDYDTNVMKKEKQKMEIFFASNYNELAEAIETWDHEWQPYVDKLKAYSKRSVDMIIEALEKDATKFKTINHGDYWLSNMLFRHDRDGRPNGLRMIDFQQSSYTSPVMDVQYLLNTSPTEEAFERKRDVFSAYCSNLVEYLQLYEYRGAVPDQKELDEAFDLAKHYGMTVALTVRPLMMMPSEHVADMETFSKNWSENKSIKFSAYSLANDKCLRILKKSLKEALDLGLL